MMEWCRSVDCGVGNCVIINAVRREVVHTLSVCARLVVQTYIVTTVSFKQPTPYHCWLHGSPLSQLDLKAHSGPLVAL